MKKILFLVQIPPPIHGASLRNQSLVESKIVSEKFRTNLLPLHFVDEIEEIGKVTPLKFWRLVKFILALIYRLAFFRPNLVYFTLSPSGNAFYRDVLIVLLLKIFCVKRVYHLRGLGIRNASKTKTNRILYQFVFRGSYVICLAKTQLADIDGLRFRKVFIVPNGIKQEVDTVQNNANSIPEILFLSNYIRSKGVFEFIELLALLKERGFKFKARMFGSPWDVSIEDLQKSAVEKGVSEIVSINPPVVGDEKFRVILDSDIFVLPTYQELFPGVVLEAMQCGKPVVSTYTGAIPEIIDEGQNGLLVDVKNPTELANKTEMLLKNASLRIEMGQNARAKFLNSFTLQKFELNMINVFNQILATPNQKKY